MQTECRTTSLLDCYAEVQLILYKDKNCKFKTYYFYCRDAVYLMKR